MQENRKQVLHPQKFQDLKTVFVRFGYLIYNNIFISVLGCNDNPLVNCAGAVCDMDGKYYNYQPYQWAVQNCPLYCGICQGMHSFVILIFKT